MAGLPSWWAPHDRDATTGVQAIATAGAGQTKAAVQARICPLHRPPRMLLASMAGVPRVLRSGANGRGTVRLASSRCGDVALERARQAEPECECEFVAFAGSGRGGNTDRISWSRPRRCSCVACQGVIPMPAGGSRTGIAHRRGNGPAATPCHTSRARIDRCPSGARHLTSGSRGPRSPVGHASRQLRSEAVELSRRG